VHSEKHIVQQSITSDTLNTVAITVLATAVAVADKTAVSDVEEGSSIKAIFLEQWVKSSGTTGLASGQWCLFKRTGDQSNPSTTDMAALGDWDNKRNILHMGMGLYNDNSADAVAVLRGWFKIPKGKQRMALGDRLLLAFFNPAVTANRCGFAIYKEYK